MHVSLLLCSEVVGGAPGVPEQVWVLQSLV